MTPSVSSPISNGYHQPFSTSHFQSTRINGHGTVTNVTNASRHASGRLNGTTRPHTSNTSGKMAEIVTILKRRCADELGAAVANEIVSSYSSLMEKISNERLRRVPTEGSAWDKVLAWAQSFAEKFNDFDQAIEQFTGGNYDGAEIAFGYIILLLDLGDENATALQTSFGFFFKCALDLIALLDRVELFNASYDINEQLILAYADLVTLVSDVALRFYQAIRGPNNSDVSIDIYTAFADTIESFQTRRDSIVDSMWKYQLSQESVDTNDSIDIKTLRSWLGIQDSVLKYKSGDHTTLVNDRHQLTCLWIQPYLSRFLNSGRDSLIITGGAGSGKTVLAGTIVDTVQRTSSRKSYNVLFVPINSRSKSQATSLNVIRSLLSQLLESRVGNVQVYKIMAETYEATQKSVDIAAYEALLWTLFENVIALTHPQAKDTLIIVDGVDEISHDAANAQKLHKHLTDASSKHEKVKLITLSQQNALPVKTVADVEIIPDIVYDDIFAIVSSLLRHHQYLQQNSQIEQDIIIDQITETAKSSFLWAKLVTKSLLKESSAEKFTKAAALLKKSPKSLQEVIREHLVSANLSEEGRQLLIWLSISERPLSVDELSLLYAIDPKTGLMSDRQIDPLHVLRPVASLVFLQEGLLYLRHATIRQVLGAHFEQIKQTLPVKEASLDFVQRLLAYLRLSIKDQKEPSFSLLTPAQAGQIFDQHGLAEYSIRYWPIHYHQLSTVSKEASPDVRKALVLMPTSPSVALLEQSAWTWQPTSVQISWHSASLDLRRQVLNRSHYHIVLQSTIVLATLLQRTGDLSASAGHFYSATQLCTNIFSVTHPLTTQCANHFLEVNSHFTTTTRTETMTRREDILSILIKSYTTQYGSSSEIVLQYQNQLLELYRALKEEKKITELEALIHEKQDTHGETTKKRTGSLGVRVVSRRNKELDYQFWNWDEEHDHDLIVHVESGKYIEELLRSAQLYASKGFVAKAEQAFIEAWHHMSLQTRTNQSLSMDRRRIELAITYAKFLQSVKRESEASALLTGVWEEYQYSSLSQSQEISSQLFTVGKVLQTLGITTVALAVFRHHSSVTKSHSSVESSSYKEVEEHITATKRELLKQASSSSGSTTHVSSSVVTEIITTIESSKSVHLDTASASAVKQIVTAFVAQKRWKEATVTIKQLLHRFWESLFSASIEDIGQPIGSPDLTLELADQLVICYESRLRFIKAQDLRERLYRAVKSTRKISDSIVKHNLTQLLRLLEQNRAREKIIQIHRDLLEDYKEAYGASHPEVIKTLWTLARLTNPEPISIEYYRQIVDLLNKDSNICHPDAFDALSTVATHYWIQRRYRDAVWAYTLLFNTFVHKGKELKQFQATSFVSTVYSRYVDSLKVSSSDTSITYQVTKQYHQACISVFGATHKFTHEVTLTLARLCRLSKRHEAEAITLYEQLLKDANSSEYHSECRATLDIIYEEKALEVARSNSLSASTEQVDRAVTVIRKRLTENRSHYGWTHEESLEQLKEVSFLYAKQSKKTEAVKELTEATSHIVTSEQRSVQLIKAASVVAASFIAVNETHRALEIAEELRWQLVTKDASNSKKYSLDVTSTGRSAAIYIAQLEHSLRQDSSLSFNEIYLSILTEIVYYEDFQQSIRSNAAVEEVFAVASRLHSFLRLKRRSVMVVHVEDELLSFFLRVSGEKAKVGDVAQVKILVTTMLEYLQTHKVKTFLHSVNLATIERVRYLLNQGQYKQACELAQTSFRYLHANNWYNTPAAIKNGLVLATIIANIGQKENKSTHGAQIQIASAIIGPMLEAARPLNLHLAAIPLKQINIIVGILGEQKDYAVLEGLLTTLWEAREAHAAWKPSVVLALGKRLVLARFLLKKHEQALHLAADIAYNLRRVYGASHLVTLEFNILLGQLYVSTGLAVQSTKGAEEIARRYYKRAIGVHENVLRSLTLDPLGLNDEDDVTVLSADPEPIDATALGVADLDASQGTYARRHLVLLKLALERYGDYPKGYAEYEQLNAEAFRTFSEELHGLDGVEKWDLKKFGGGKAESDEGALDVNVKNWALTEEKGEIAVNGNGNGIPNGAAANGFH